MSNPLPVDVAKEATRAAQSHGESAAELAAAIRKSGGLTDAVLSGLPEAVEESVEETESPLAPTPFEEDAAGGEDAAPADDASAGEEGSADAPAEDVAAEGDGS